MNDSPESHPESGDTHGKTHETAEAFVDRSTFELADLVRFIDRNWLVITGTGLLFAAVVWIFSSVLASPKYEAAATLVVLPPKFTSQLKPEALTVQGYQRLLESDAVVAETARQLVEKGLIKEGEALRVGDEIRSRIFVSRRAEETTLAPIIEATARAGNPEEAALTANTWATVFLAHNRDLRVTGVDATIEFIQTEYAKEREKVEELTAELNTTVARYDEQIDEVELAWNARMDEEAARWSRRLVDHEKETDDQVAAYQIETRRTLEELAAERLPDLARPAEGDGGGSVALEERIRRITTLRVQLAQTPQILVLEKGIPEEVLWEVQALIKDTKAGRFQSALNRTLLTQELNPVHSQILLELSRAETELDELLEPRIEAVRPLLLSLEQRQRERSTGLSQLLADRAVAYRELTQERGRELETLRRQRDREVAALNRERQHRLEVIEKDLAVEAELVAEMARKNQQAELARSERDVADVRLGSRAVPPLKPKTRHALPKTLVALVCGLFLGAVGAVVREVHRERNRG